jgi:DNA-damage-inducible protein J
MTKSAMIRARIRPELKDAVEKILAELGLNPTEAITLFYEQIRLRQGLPFAVKLPDTKPTDTN